MNQKENKTLVDLLSTKNFDLDRKAKSAIRSLREKCNHNIMDINFTHNINVYDYLQMNYIKNQFILSCFNCGVIIEFCDELLF